LNLSRGALPYKYIKAALGDSRGGQFDALISPRAELSIRLRERLAELDLTQDLIIKRHSGTKKPRQHMCWRGF